MRGMVYVLIKSRGDGETSFSHLLMGAIPMFLPLEKLRDRRSLVGCLL